MSIEAMTLVRRAIRTAQNNLAPSRGSAHAFGDGELWDMYENAITSLRQAIAEAKSFRYGEHPVSFGLSAGEWVSDKEFWENLSPRQWPQLMQGVRVEGDTVVISTKNNDAARELCGALLQEKEV